jgi:hypothetical protein
MGLEEKMDRLYLVEGQVVCALYCWSIPRHVSFRDEILFNH